MLPFILLLSLSRIQYRYRLTFLEKQVVLAQSIDEAGGGGLAEWRGAAEDGMQPIERVQFDVGIVAEEGDQRRHQVHHGRLSSGPQFPVNSI